MPDFGIRGNAAELSQIVRVALQRGHLLQKYERKLRAAITVSSFRRNANEPPSGNVTTLTCNCPGRRALVDD